MPRTWKIRETITKSRGKSALLTKETILQTTPDIVTWEKLLVEPLGNVFGTSVKEWQQKTRASLGLETDANIIIVGHQPIFFHPGILAKFIAASEFARQCNAKLVHLVVDHHAGDVGTIESPKLQNGLLQIEQKHIVKSDTFIPLCDQKPLEVMTADVRFLEALDNEEQNAAMQIAAATDILMAQYAKVDVKIAATSLPKTPLGEALLEEMFARPEACHSAYNNAVAAFPESGISFLEAGALPIWKDDRHGTRPRALFLTLLARLGIGNLFVHGTGGASYDRVMEQWCLDWLGVQVCPQVMATATMKLPLKIETISSARSVYFSGDDLKKQAFLSNIESLTRGSAARRVAYLDMHRMLAACGKKPDHKALLASQKIASKRDWAFPLYDEAELMKLTKVL